jgi:hypothetical protein
MANQSTAVIGAAPARPAKKADPYPFWLGGTSVSRKAVLFLSGLAHVGLNAAGVAATIAASITQCVPP